MSMHRILTTALLLIALALAGCGGEDSTTGTSGTMNRAAPKQATVDSSLAALVPSDAVALVYVRSPKDLQTKLRGMISRFDAEAAAEVDLGAMVGSMVMNQGEHVDLAKPMAIALSLPAEGADAGDLLGGDGRAIIIGMKDAAAAKAAIEKAMEERFADIPEKFRPKPEEQPTISISGSYLTMAQGAPGDRGASKLATTAPTADLALRIDLARLVERFREDIDARLKDMESGMADSADAMPPGMESLAGMFKGIGTFLRDFVDSAETLDLGISMDGGEAEIALGFVAKKGSKLDVPGHKHEGLEAMAALLPEGMPINALASIDMGGLMKWLAPLMEAGMAEMDEEQKKAWKRYIDESTEIAALLGPNLALSLSMGEGGMQMVEIVDVKDGATYMKRVDEMLAGDLLDAMPGMSAGKTGTSSVAGVDVHSYALTMDLVAMMEAQGQDVPEEARGMMQGMMERLFGGDAMTFHMATLENKLLFTMGDTGSLERIIQGVRKGGGTVPAGLAKGLERAGGSPVFVLHVELRSMLDSIMGLAAEVADQPMPDVPEGGPIPVWVWGKHDGRVYGGGLRVDVHGIADLVEAMSGGNAEPGEDEDGK